MWGSKRRSRDEGYPDDFHTKNIQLESALAIADLPPLEIAEYFRQHLETAERLLFESYDKRCGPSSYITEDGDGFSVGWCSRRSELQYTRHFSNLADAATDYLLFSLGKGRWTPS